MDNIILNYGNQKLELKKSSFDVNNKKILLQQAVWNDTDPESE